MTAAIPRRPGRPVRGNPAPRSCQRYKHVRKLGHVECSGGAMRKHSPPSAATQSAMPDLTLTDTCDQCGAAACVRVAVTDAQHLDFCGHHYTEHAMTLLAAGYRVLDRRGLASSV